MDMKDVYYRKLIGWAAALMLSIVIWSNPDVVKASHFSASSLTYSHRGGLNYAVDLRLVVDCPSVIVVNPELELMAGACGQSVVIGQRAIPYNVDTQSIFAPTVPQQWQCASGPLSYTGASKIIYHYRWVVQLPSRRPDWIFVYKGGPRQFVANLLSGSGALHRLEARLNNLAVDGNSSASPNLVDYLNPIVFAGMPFTQTFLAFDEDDDSLSYRLIAPLTSCSTRSTYKAYGLGVYHDTLSPNPRYIPLNSGTYSAENPIGSIIIDRQTGVASHRSIFDPATGAFCCTPSRYSSNGRSGEDNYYIVMVEVQEWRRVLGGAPILVGQTEIESQFQVASVPNSQMPYFSPSAAQRLNPFATIRQVDSSTIKATAGPCLNNVLRIPFNDRGPNQNISIDFDARFLPRSVASLSVEGQNTNEAKLVVTLDPNARSPVGHFKIPLRVRDDTYPMALARGYILDLTLDDDNVPAIVTANGQILKVGVIVGAQYQWLLNGQPIPGATDTLLSITQDGSYSVRITNGTCITYSAVRVITHLSPAQLLSQISLYPNPASQHTTIKAPSEFWAKVQSVKVVNALGQVVLSQPVQQDADGQMTLPLSGLKSGHYWLRYGGLGVGKVLVVE